MLSTAQATASPTMVAAPSVVRWRRILLALPLVGLGVLIARPELNVQWHHHQAHFWLVLATGAVSVVLASVTNMAAGRHRDARVTLVSLAFLASAGFLGLHALPAEFREHRDAYVDAVVDDWLGGMLRAAT